MPTMSFETDRARLRALEKSDAAALQAYLNEPSMIGCRCIPWEMRDVAPLSMEETERLIDSFAKEKKSITLGIALRETGRLVGHVGWHWGWDTHCPSAWVVVAPGHRRRGIGSEVLEHLLGHLFLDTPAHNVNGWIGSWNGAGLAFAAALGFTETGRVPRGGIRGGAYYDDVMVDMLKPEWLGRGGGRGA
jgi:RimJ/RimL family protein N-acetyltransferase